MRAIWFLALMLLSLIASAAQPTHDQLVRAFTHYRLSLRSALNMPGPSSAEPNGEPRLATRSDALKLMEDTIEEFRIRFTYTPRPSLYSDEIARRFNSAEDVPRIRSLAQGGFLAPAGPIVVGPGESLEATEFGRAIGFFFARLADLTHEPSIKWSPYLQRPDG